MSWMWIGGPVGDWYELPDGKWRYDPSAPSATPEVTAILPSVSPTPEADVDPDQMPPEDQHATGDEP